MRNIIQIFLIIILIFLILLFYNKYLKNNNDTNYNDINNKNISEKFSIDENINNTIQNLEYNITINQENNYKLSSKASEIIYEGNIELIKMYDVKATFKNKNKNDIIIKSEEAIYNNENYYTTFNKNVTIEYLENMIFGDSLNLNIEKNFMIISGNVKFDGLTGQLFTDNIKLDMTTKKIEMFMNDKNKKVFLNKK
jgi:lipopolysaccharide export system protein LptA